MITQWRDTSQVNSTTSRTSPTITCDGTGVVSNAGTVLLASIAFWPSAADSPSQSAQRNETECSSTMPAAAGMEILMDAPLVVLPVRAGPRGSAVGHRPGHIGTFVPTAGTGPSPCCQNACPANRPRRVIAGGVPGASPAGPGAVVVVSGLERAPGRRRPAHPRARRGPAAAEIGPAAPRGHCNEVRAHRRRPGRTFDPVCKATSRARFPEEQVPVRRDDTQSDVFPPRRRMGKMRT